MTCKKGENAMEKTKKELESKKLDDDSTKNVTGGKRHGGEEFSDESLSGTSQSRPAKHKKDRIEDEFD